MIPANKRIASTFRTSSQLMARPCSICSSGSPPCPESQPWSFHLPTRPSLIALCYFSAVISFSLSPSFCFRYRGLWPQGLFTCCSCLSASLSPHLHCHVLKQAFTECLVFAHPSLPIFLPYLDFLHLTCHLLTLQAFDWFNLFRPLTAGMSTLCGQSFSLLCSLLYP